MSDIVDRKPPIPANSNTATTKLTTGLIGLVAMRPFGVVLESSYNDEKSSDSESSDERGQGDRADRSESSSERGVSDHENVRQRGASGEGPARLTAAGNKKQDPQMQALAAHTEGIIAPQTHRDPSFTNTLGGDGKPGPRSTSGKSNGVVSPTMLGAEQAMKQLEKMPALTSAKTLPPEVLNHLVAQISTLYAGDQKQVFIRFQNAALGGNLSARIHRDDDGSTIVSFEGDSEVLASLESHQDELKESLGQRGMRPVLRFI